MLRDEAIRPKPKANPYRRERPPTKISPAIKAGVFVCTTLVTLGLLCMHTFFKIDFIDISGLERISEREFEEKVQGVIDTKRFLFLPGDNYFLVNMREVHAILSEKYPLEKLHIEKQFPGKLNITVEEKISTVIYDNGSTYSTIGVDGRVVEFLRGVGDNEWRESVRIIDVATTTPSSTLERIVTRTHVPAARLVMDEFGDYPILYDTRAQDASVNAQVVSSEIAAGAITWFQALERETAFSLRHIEITDQTGSADIYLFTGQVLHVLLDKNVDEQINGLTFLLENEITDTFSYIDLRYGERMYWR